MGKSNLYNDEWKFLDQIKEWNKSNIGVPSRWFIHNIRSKMSKKRYYSIEKLVSFKGREL